MISCMSNRNVYDMLDIFISIVENTASRDSVGFYHLQKEDGTIIERENNFFQSGNYYLCAASEDFGHLVLCCTS